MIRIALQSCNNETDSLEKIKQKLAQFPPGSDFTWGISGVPESEEEKGMAHDLSEFLANHGMKLTIPAK